MAASVPQIDYTSRDYAAIRSDMLAGIAARLPEWMSRSSNDFGVVLLELFATMGDALNFYIDRVANEGFLTTATQRSSVLALARLLDYRPNDPTAATSTLTVANAGASPVTVTAGSQFATSSSPSGTASAVYFEAVADVTIGASSSAAVAVVEGRTVTDEAVGTSTGYSDQDFPLAQSPVIGGSVVVHVNEGSGATAWTYYDHLIDASNDTAAYTLYTDENAVTHIVFGDSVSGRVPITGAIVTATYRLGSGSAGNVQTNAITRVISSLGPVSVTGSTAATGGTDAESNDSIRTNAPASLASLGRAVTLADYESLALAVNHVSKAKAVASTYSSVTLYLGSDQGAVALPSSVSTAVTAALTPCLPAGASLTLQSLTALPINITVSVTVDSRYSAAAVGTAVKNALQTLLAYDNVSFADRIAVSDVYSVMASVPGVLYGTVSVLSTSGAGCADIAAAANQIPTAGTVTVNATGGL